MIDDFKHLPRFRETRTGFVSACPAHQDRNPSLHGTLRNGKLLLHCWTGCTTREILAAMGLTWDALFEDALTPQKREEAVRVRYCRMRAAHDRDEELNRLAEWLRVAASIISDPRTADGMSEEWTALLASVYREMTFWEWRYEELSMSSR